MSPLLTFPDFPDWVLRVALLAIVALAGWAWLALDDSPPIVDDDDEEDTRGW